MNTGRVVMSLSTRGAASGVVGGGTFAMKITSLRRLITYSCIKVISTGGRTSGVGGTNFAAAGNRFMGTPVVGRLPLALMDLRRLRVVQCVASVASLRGI